MENIQNRLGETSRRLLGDPLLQTEMRLDDELGHRYGIKTADGSLAFPNAEIKVPTQDWAFWMSDDNAGKAANDMMKGYFATRARFSPISQIVTNYD